MTMAMAVMGIVVGLAIAAKGQTAITIESGQIGSRFCGIGGISGGGATSRLLYDYAPAVRNYLLDYVGLLWLAGCLLSGSLD
jgi:hypothetical protein